MISRLNEYLENLDKKNLIMLYMSVLILFVMIGYFLYENIIIPRKKELINQRRSLLEKIREMRNNNQSVVLLKRELKDKRIKLNEAKEDLKYLKVLIFTTPKLNISQKEYLNILESYIQVGANINASFELNETKALNKYNIKISGKFLPLKYFIFVKFLKVLQQPNKIITINDFNMEYNNSVNYYIDLSMWGFE